MVLLFLALALSGLWASSSGKDPEEMSTVEIAEEMSTLYSTQQAKLETLQLELPKVRTQLEKSLMDLETLHRTSEKLGINLATLSGRLETLSPTVSVLADSMRNLNEGLVSQNKRLATALIITLVVAVLAPTIILLVKGSN